jgi:hypothetical protein
MFHERNLLTVRKFYLLLVRYKWLLAPGQGPLPSSLN